VAGPTGGLDGITQFAGASNVSSQSQDGYASGDLSGIVVDGTGVVKGLYTNGQKLAIGQLAIAKFRSNEGLGAAGHNMWIETRDSGNGRHGHRRQRRPRRRIGGSGRAVERRLAGQFVDLIAHQRAFEANSKTITTPTRCSSSSRTSSGERSPALTFVTAMEDEQSPEQENAKPVKKGATHHRSAARRGRRDGRERGGGAVLGPSLAGNKAQAAAHAPAASASSSEDAPPGEASTLEPIIVDVREASGEIHHLKVGLAIELGQGVTEEEFKKARAAHARRSHLVLAQSALRRDHDARQVRSHPHRAR